LKGGPHEYKIRVNKRLVRRLYVLDLSGRWACRSAIPAHLAQAFLEIPCQNVHRLTFGAVFERQS
jgi:hypothetical protein